MNVSRFNRVDKSMEHFHECIEGIKKDSLRVARAGPITRADLESELGRMRSGISAEIANAIAIREVTMGDILVRLRVLEMKLMDRDGR